ALEKVWVNIHDLLMAVRNETTPVKRFKSKGALINYTHKHNLFYPLRKAKEGGPVRALLVHMF
ncbi:hypothetical protein B0J14DRAFT_477791, partial [Halenospora varia]